MLLLPFAFVGVPLLATFHIWPFGSDYLLRAILIPFLILALAAIGLNILVGYCGQISLGSGAFMAIGAYCAYKFGTGVHIPLAWFGTAISIPAAAGAALDPARRADGGRSSASCSASRACASRGSIWRWRRSRRSSSSTGCSSA